MASEISRRTDLEAGFVRLGRPCYVVEEVDSTQNLLYSLAQAGAPEGTLLLAERQTQGRGRRGRTWQTLPGALTFSLLLRPKLPPEALTLIPLAAGVALQEATGIGGLKWPNDLLVPDGRKLAGILGEVSAGGQLLILGVGLNLTAAPPGGAALHEFRPLAREEVLKAFLRNLEDQLADLSGVVPAWRARSAIWGKEIEVAGQRGRALDLAPDGALLLEVSGRITTITAGEVRLLGGIP
jgi:BirA family biotin operon repressor/biotin-[acetyl-CoA-carboxylase] ligase